MEIIKPEDKPIAVHDYEFKHLGSASPTIVTIFPSMGDSMTETNDGWLFRFPRMQEEQTMFRTPNLLGLLVRKSERIYLDPNEIARRIIEEKKRQAKEREAKDAEKAVEGQS